MKIPETFVTSKIKLLTHAMCVLPLTKVKTSVTTELEIASRINFQSFQIPVSHSIFVNIGGEKKTSRITVFS